MLVLKIKEKSFIYSHHKNIYQPLFISTLWLSGSARVEAELYPDYRNHSRRLSQFTTYCNLHFLLLSAPYCKGSRGINNKSRRNRTDICIYNIHPCCCRATGAGAVPGTTEVFTALCANSPLAGQRNSIRMYQNPMPWARTVCETQQPLAKGIPWPLIHCRDTALLAARGHGQGGFPPTAESGQEVPQWLHDFSPLPSLQCALCFLFLCFLSFLLLAHLEQNHCISSGGAAVSPTQGLWRTGKYHIISVEWHCFCFLFPQKMQLSSGRQDLAFELI